MKTLRQNQAIRHHRAFSTIEPLESRIAPAVILVTTLVDTTNTNHTTGSLRDALALADADLLLHPGVINTIKFKLPAAAVHTENIITLTGGVLTSNGDVNIVGPGAGKLIINGNAASGVFDFSDPSTTKDSPVSISGLSIINGKTTGNGGGIFSNDSLTLKNVVVSGNSATDTAGVAVVGSAATGTKFSISDSLVTGNAGGSGGGVALYTVKSFSMVNTVITGHSSCGDTDSGGFYSGFASNGTGGSIAGCVIAGNSAGGYGGGLLLDNGSTVATAKITISGTKITGNTSLSTFDQDGGGGIFISGVNTVITGSTIENNTAVYEGGGVSASGFTSLTISKSVIEGNSTTKTNASNQGGGGLFIEGTGASTPATVNITGSEISDNTSALDGGGLFAEDGIALSVTSSTFSGNKAAVTGHGGGICLTGSGTDKVNLTISSSLFSNNTAMFGGGIRAIGDGTVSLTGSKLTGNFAANGGGMYTDTNPVTIKNTAITDNATTGIGAGLSIAFTSDFVIKGGSITGNATQLKGGGVYAYGAGGSITGVTISGNAAEIAGGGVFNGGTTPGIVTLQIAKVTANSAPVGTDVDDTPGNLSTFKFV